VHSPAPVKDSVLEPREFIARFEAASGRAGFRPEQFGEVEGVPLVAFTHRTPGPRPRIYLSAGIHGDEPAPPLALLELLERGVFDARAVWFLCPLLNPLGFLRRTRENPAGVDLNRDYKSRLSAEIRAHTRWLEKQPPLDLAICLHEDWEAHGFYVYELNPTGQPSLAHAMLGAVAPVCPIETASVIDGRPIAETGIIRPVADPALRELWPESIYLQAQHGRLGYTIETPSALPLRQRRAALVAAVTCAVETACGRRAGSADFRLPTLGAAGKPPRGLTNCFGRNSLPRQDRCGPSSTPDSLPSEPQRNQNSRSRP
jgi:protein MpaA